MKIYVGNKKSTTLPWQRVNKLVKLGMTGKFARQTEVYYFNGTVVMQKQLSRKMRMIFGRGIFEFRCKDLREDHYRESTI